MVNTLGCDRTPPAPSVDAAKGTVTVVIQTSKAVPKTVLVKEFADGTSLEAVMRSIDQIPVEISGSGQTAFVQSMGDVATDATQGWTFKVDGEFANQGMGVTVLHPPTTVTWSFGEFEM